MDSELVEVLFTDKSLDAPLADKVMALERELLKMPQVECPVKHTFLPGVYIREVKIPAGVAAVGHFQSTAHKNVFLSGRILMPNEDGTVSELVAPMEFIGNPGKKCGYILEDVVWINVYETREQDVSVLEEMFLDKDKSSPVDPRREEIKLLGEPVDSEVPDLIPFFPGTYKVALANTQDGGKGLFASSPIESGEVIALARISGNMTPAGYYTRCSNTPNAIWDIDEYGDIQLIATKNISGNYSGFMGEEITVLSPMEEL